LIARYEKLFPSSPEAAIFAVYGLKENARLVLTRSDASGNAKNPKDLHAHRVLPAQRQEVLCALDGLGDFAQQFLQIFVAIDEINL